MKKRLLYYALIVFFALVFLFCAWNLGVYFLEGFTSQSDFRDLANRVDNAQDGPQPTVYLTQPTQPNSPTGTTDPAEESGDTQPTEPSAPVILPEYAQLYLDNPDLVGWIQIEGTEVNYPVMQTPDRPDYYLYRNFEGKDSRRGCIYVDEACDVFAPSDNLTIYGHHMQDGSMFTKVTRYSSRSFYQEHPYIIFNTLLEKNTYEIIAVFRTTASVGQGFRYNAFVDASSPEEFDEYVSTCKRLSLYSIATTAEFGDKLITLSTCEYTQTNGRFVVVAKLIQTETNDTVEPQS